MADIDQTEEAMDQLMTAAIEEKPVDFTNAFETLIKDKLTQAVEARKVELAQSLFGAPEGLDLGEDDEDEVTEEIDEEISDEDEEYDEDEETDEETSDENEEDNTELTEEQFNEARAMFRPSYKGWKTGEDDGKTYKVVRFHKGGSPKTIKSGLTLGQARSHCQHPETSSSTCKERAGKNYTKNHGEWFDGYDKA